MIERSFGMPVIALLLNISWEFTYSIMFPFEGYKLYLNCLWLACDVVILTQFIMYGGIQRYFSFAGTMRFAGFIIVLIAALSFVWVMHAEFNDHRGKLTAYIINLIMSSAFLLRALRSNYDGQSIYIGVLKMIGTGVPSILFYLKNPDSNVLNALYISVFVIDGLYISVLRKKLHEAGLSWSIRV
jgi:hypothetical protein